ncbi:hypothetical protein AJ80_07016 [Polytolypa hystricis UAMH7299]|uniref:TIGR00297 family protein n=1 Tax=Polytolypa hystricis (strain UAMH7299) TaxID=1447883 RepID=A0A2B7XS25_POLH7|nr:hypothetical protein AJ80_07016 [Polytolypa hystricis UAMH7299]
MKVILAVPAIVAIVYRAWSRKSLTPIGLVVAALTASIHAIYPSPVPFACLAVFFLGGTTMTKIKHGIKARLTVSSSGSAGGEGPRNHVQVLANSVVATILIIFHARYFPDSNGSTCFPWGGDILTVGIIANYAAVAADTYSSELGILSKSSPRLITSPTLREVPPGTNGGVTLAGLLAGVLGAFTIALTTVLLLPFCGTGSGHGITASGLDGGKAWGLREKVLWVVAITVWGVLGSVLDSFLGGLLQASVVDKRTGKVVEGDGGRKVLIHPGEVISTGIHDGSIRVRRASAADTAVAPPSTDADYESRKIETGYDILDNNAVNVLMALIMSVGGMAVASYVWDMPFLSSLI